MIPVHTSLLSHGHALVFIKVGMLPVGVCRNKTQGQTVIVCFFDYTVTEFTFWKFKREMLQETTQLYAKSIQTGHVLKSPNYVYMSKLGMEE